VKGKTGEEKELFFLTCLILGLLLPSTKDKIHGYRD